MWAYKNAWSHHVILCSKPPLTCCVIQGASLALPGHIYLPPLHLWPPLPSLPPSFCYSHTGLPALWIYKLAPTTDHLHLLFCLPGVHQLGVCPPPQCLFGPAYQQLPPQPQPSPSSFSIHFSSWSLVLANMLHNFLICLIVCILSLQCKPWKGQNFYLFALVRHLECLAYSPASAGLDQLITMRADVFHVVFSYAFHQSAYVIFLTTLW